MRQTPLHQSCKTVRRCDPHMIEQHMRTAAAQGMRHQQFCIEARGIAHLFQLRSCSSNRFYYGCGRHGLVVQRCKTLCLIFCDQRIDHFSKTAARNHFGQFVQGQPNAVIGDAALREVIGTDAF